MRPRRDRPAGPSPVALLVLGIASLVMLATGAPIPTVESAAIGEAALGPNEVVEHELRIRIAPEAGSGADTGTLSVQFIASSGLDSAYTEAASIVATEIPPPGATAAPRGQLPLDRCRAGCDLVFTVAVRAGPDVLPGSVARYQVEAALTYRSTPAPIAGFDLALEGAVTGPSPLIWAGVGGVLALVIGILAGPWVAGRLGDRRRWLAIAATAIPVVILVVGLVDRSLTLMRFLGDLGDLGDEILSALMFLLDPWAVTLFGVLSWGLVRGLRRWDADGGWLFGVAAVALAGLGGLWLAWRTSMEAISQPVIATIVAITLGGITGLAIGYAWRTDPRADHDRWWAGLAVVAHGIVIFGFGFLAAISLAEPFASANGQGLVLLLPAALIALAFRPWFNGRRVPLIVFDAIVAVVGVFGALAVGSLSAMFSADPLAIDDVAIAIAVVASVVAFVTASHRMPRRDATGAVIPPAEPQVDPAPDPAPPPAPPPGSPLDPPPERPADAPATT